MIAMKSARTLVTAGVFALFASHAAHAQWLDIYGTRKNVSASPAAPMLKNATCQPELANRPIELEDAMLQAICANPQARQAWANARAQAAQVGVKEAAYLPALNATAGVQRNWQSTTYEANFGSITASDTQRQTQTSRYGALNLSWVLFDFGKRSAALRQARELLAAANATQDDTLQTILFNAAQAYYTLRDAQASVDAARTIERAAQDSLTESKAKHDAGAGTLSDQLQAQTSYRRAVLDRVSAEGDVQNATGTLAVAMGLDANTPLQIAPAEVAVNRNEFAEGVAQLIDEAKRQHPKLVAARAKLDAARANVDAARAQGRPTISLTGSLSRNSPSYQQQFGIQTTGSHGSMIGVQVTIPLFEGFASGYRVEAAQAQADAQEADVQNTELNVSLDVWKSYQSLQTDTANLDNSKDLLGDAQHSLDIARGRYKAGVGTFTELLNAQTALADAQKQRVQALSKWRTARLKLAASLGSIGLWSAH
ncbi:MULTISPECIES: TolC family protein [Burkholderia]|uniref:TolC family protein n=1 Tax=Burkholderia TaxID=32008 RepID=UPI0007535F5D|nr:MULTISPECIES: TolC family protein [Burkholderia]AOJ67562.1 channel protein TolC [Burkholderia savannae]KVG40917.1 channel protein TolC [Burkholderia sp. MSMB0265]KVG85389.1 channel protein TolC [Burkholderia sp. MSMB2040]KVG94617.1 channel protein TolC [Burkholderia sp. MSMB2042]KVG95048.1 channel protein TolC [Burkholderia sp. MSMB2041]